MSPQHDYIIDNSTGANVRSDINSVLQAIASNNSGSSAPSTTVASQFFADTTNDILKLRNAANNAFVNLRGFDGSLHLPDGSASSPSLFFDDDTNTGIFSGGADEINIVAGGIRRADFGNAIVFNEDGADVDLRIEGDTEANLFYVDAGNNRIGIGTTTIGNKLQVHEASSNASFAGFSNDTTGSSSSDGLIVGIDSNEDGLLYHYENKAIRFGTNNSEVARIDNSGNFAIGTTSAVQKLHIDGGSNDPFLLLQRSGAGDSAVDIGGMQMKNSTNVLADIRCRSSDINDGFLKFSAMKAGTLTERQRFSANTASVYIGRVGGEVSVASDDRTFSEGIGVTLAGGGEGGGSYNVFTADNTTTMYIGRQFSDGQLIQFRQAGSEEGNIAVSGSTVSYNGGHLSRWSQLSGISSTDKSARPTIYQGTVMSNLDELCSWSHSDVLYTEEDEKNDDIPDGKKVGDIRRAAYTEDNQQLNMTKVSDIEGDKDVAGVFWAWDDDDDEIVNDFYVAMTGDMVIRVAASTTVARGDLLISAGDGTAKPQADDIVRSSTIAKIISTNHTATYPDGSKAYPCVLMAC